MVAGSPCHSQPTSRWCRPSRSRHGSGRCGPASARDRQGLVG
jgi:hypothetical protein